MSSLAAIQQSTRSARTAGLRYVDDQQPGLRRIRVGTGFTYRNSKGQPVRDPQVLGRIRSLAIPPAWNDVWICASPRGHIQASGRDARGRKQYRYHTAWRETRDETKYGRLSSFAKALPRIRARATLELSKPGLGREKVLAAVVRLLESTRIRIGNATYARDNQSYGLTTFRGRHVDVRGAKLQFHFRGKSKKWHEISLTDRPLAKVVSACQHLPGQELFQYLDNGKRHAIHSHDVNAYLRSTTGEDFTAKDFRTWAGTLEATTALQGVGPSTTKTEAKRKVVSAIQTVALKLGNTPAVCRKSYIHPVVVSAYLDGKLERFRGRSPRTTVLQLLKAA